MRNYVIINGVNSLTIKGLAINIMPPISKPPMRTLREEIDGRNGDITTDLGYGAYDKTIEVGLYGNYDIDEVIAFFNSKGTIVFSDEDDKYYNFEITDRIDYSKLVKFRTASINFHCQPFKYPLNETPLEEEYEYVEGEGTELTLNDTANALFNKFDLLGNTEQTQYTGKNLFNDNFNDYTRPLDYLIHPITLEQGQAYTLKATLTGTKVSGIVVGIVPTGEKYADFSTRMFIAINSGGNTEAKRTITIDETWTSPKLIVYCPASTLQATFESIFENYEIQLEKGSTATDYEPFVGGIPSPSPSYPQPIQVVSGDNTIDIVGKNLFDENTILTSSNFTYSNGYYTGLSNDLRSYMSANRDIINFKENTQYTVSLTGYLGNATNVRVRFVYTDLEWTETTYLTSSSSRIMGTSTAGKTIAYIILNYSTAGTIYIKDFQVEESATATSYEPYQSQSYAVNLGTLELCKIGTYQDYIYKDNGNWYVHKEIGKDVLNGSESGWALYNASGTAPRRFGLYQTKWYKNSIPLLSDYFIGGEYNSQVDLSIWTQTSYLAITDKNSKWANAISLQTWLASNNVTVYYVLATPTINPITDEDLIAQLEALKQANSYDGQTNISHEYNGSPFILDVAAVQKGSDILVVNNEGNIYARPTLDIEGTGIVNVYLEGNQMFQVDLSETNEIVINTQEMEAYNPTTNALANRQVVGDYSKFKLDSGENDLRFSGALTKATITNYERWL